MRRVSGLSIVRGNIYIDKCAVWTNSKQVCRFLEQFHPSSLPGVLDFSLHFFSEFKFYENCILSINDIGFPLKLCIYTLILLNNVTVWLSMVSFIVCAAKIRSKEPYGKNTSIRQMPDAISFRLRSQDDQYEQVR